VEEMGCRVRRILAVVDREEGGRENLEERGYRLESIFTASELLAAGD
jgi:orotate phosphoribosyltransferase